MISFVWYWGVRYICATFLNLIRSPMDPNAVENILYLADSYKVSSVLTFFAF